MLLLFASHNGASRSLKQMLAQLPSVKAPNESLRVVAVDSASTDDTLNLLDRSDDVFDQVLSTKQRGKNTALNLALDTVIDELDDDELIVFTDDDVLPDLNWLRAYEAAAAYLPQVDLFGGRIDPVFPEDIPHWLSALRPQFDVLFAAIDLPTGPCNALHIFGPNMAIRARCFKDGTRFDETIGPNGTKTYPMGSESELCGRLSSAGRISHFVSEAQVGHIITSDQMSHEAVMRRAKRHGAGYAQMQLKENTVATMAGAPRWMWRRYMSSFFSLATAYVSGAKETLAKARYQHAWINGAIQRSREVTQFGLNPPLS